MNYQDKLKTRVVNEERAIRQQFERDWWEQFQQQSWHDQLDQDEAAVQDFLELGER